ncbi:DUF5787 family protein [Halobacterium litoreum]|uniref:DUF5787 family protein n=1 Tax=Halobacterium litoreum TaxID=2039234 RepID=A0ABD5NI21_9EURY|nr:DUF5787 family protein [Halobacterium litoreum]UHH12621.1 DUF5787 family protein [Halobacterium litoreum]
MADSEFGFELRVCAWAEQWPPDGDAASFVARQLGTRNRRWDTLVIEVDPDALRRRADFGAERLDSDLLHVVRHAPDDWQFYRDALPHPGYPWRYVREAVHRASDRDVVETRRDGNKIQLRRKWAYPDWVERIVAIENKPDLDASAADALADQLERDVALGLADEVWLATESDGDGVERALLTEMPVEAGILAFDGGEASVEWHPRTLAAEAAGTRITERPSGGEYDQSAARFEYVDADWKREKRLEIAERAYERGWRSYLDTMRPDCRHFDVERGEHGYLPRCRAKNREQTAAECSGSCPEYEPEPPAWRQKEWPIEGGPGAAIRRVLDARRSRER